MNGGELSEREGSSTGSDYGTFLSKVAHVVPDQALRAARRSSTAAPFVNHERFELRRYLGSGSFGVVYEAFDRRLAANVAIKVLSSAQPERLYLFKREFRLAADVVHPNLLALFELFSSHDAWFFTTELVDGRPLLEALREPPEATESTGSHQSAGRSASPDPRALLRIVRSFLQFSYGVEALHSAGLLHRDLKPSNVLLDRRGRVVVVDFGLAKVLRTDEIPCLRDERVLHGKLVGTPGYVAPEVVRGEPEGTPGDWFSFGVMLYQALTGRRPFTLAADVLSPGPAASPLSPAELGLTLPPALESLCMALLSDHGSQRPDAELVIATLARVLGEEVPRGAPRAAASQAAATLESENKRALLHVLYRDSARLPRLVLLEGASGVGTTDLVRSFLKELVEQDAPPLLLTTRCCERELIPYRALDGAMDGLWCELMTLSAVERRALLPPDTGALGRLFAVMRLLDGESDASSAQPESSAALRGRALCALQALLHALGRAGKPVVLFIDDIHWGDVDSVQMLAELLDPASPPLFVLATAHTFDGQASGCLQELSRSLGEVRTVGNIDSVKVRLFAGIAGASATARRVARRDKHSDKVESKKESFSQAPWTETNR